MAMHCNSAAGAKGSHFVGGKLQPLRSGGIRLVIAHDMTSALPLVASNASTRFLGQRQRSLAIAITLPLRGLGLLLPWLTLTSDVRGHQWQVLGQGAGTEVQAVEAVDGLGG